MSLPPLPECTIAREECAVSSGEYHTQAQMQAYGQQCWEAALEESAIDTSALLNLRQVVDLQAEIILEREMDIGKLETDANKWREFQAALDRGEDRS